MSTQVREVVKLVNTHISKHPTDSVSAGKVLSTVATFAYKNDIPKEVIQHKHSQLRHNISKTSMFHLTAKQCNIGVTFKPI